MKYLNKIPYIIIGLLLAMAGTVYAATVFNSQQLAPSPSNGNCLKTNGANPGVNNWGSCGGAGGAASASPPSLSLQYNDGSGALLGSANLLFNGTQVALNGTLNATSSKFTNASTSALTVTGNSYLTGVTNSYLATTPVGLIVATTTPILSLQAGSGISVSGNTITNVMASSTLTGGGIATFSPNIIFASTTDTNILLNVFCATATCTFNPGWTGTLADARITSAATWNAKQNALTFPLSVANGGTGAPALTANDILFGNGANAVATSSSLTWNGTVFTTTNASTTVLTAPTLFLTGLASTILAVDPNGMVIATTTSAGGVTAVNGSGSILSSGGATPSLQLQPLTLTNVLFGLGTNVIGTSTTFTYSTTTNNLFVTNASSTTQTVGTLFVTGQSNLTTVSTTPLTVTGAFYATGSTTLSSLTAGCVNSTSGGALFVAGCASGGGGGGLGTSTPFSTGFIPMATGTNVTLSNSVVFQSGGNVGIATTTPNTSLYVIGSSTISSLGAGMVQSTAYGALFSTSLTGTGLAVLQTSPTLITPIIGVASGTALSLSGIGYFPTISGSTTMSSLNVAGTVQTTATGALFVTADTGSGLVVNQTSPTLITPILGIASGTSLSLATDLWVAGKTNLGNASTTGLSVSNNLWVTSTTTLSSALFVAGQLGVGTTTPSARFFVQNAGGTADIFQMASSSGAIMTRFDQHGHLQIGTSTDNSNLAIQGRSSQTDSLFNVASSSGVTVFSIDKDGHILISPTVNATTAFVMNNAAGSAILTVDTTPSGNTSKVFQVSTTTPANDYFLAVMGNSHLSASTTLPTISACGTTPSVTGGGDTNFEIQVGSVSATTCTATFARPFTNKPICTISGQTGTIALSYTISTTAIVVTNAALTSDIVDIICLGRQE